MVSAVAQDSQDGKMLHELLLALWGTEGDVFRRTPEGVRVVPTLTFLHPSEVALLNRICQVTRLLPAYHRYCLLRVMSPLPCGRRSGYLQQFLFWGPTHCFEQIGDLYSYICEYVKAHRTSTFGDATATPCGECAGVAAAINHGPNASATCRVELTD